MPRLGPVVLVALLGVAACKKVAPPDAAATAAKQASRAADAAPPVRHPRGHTDVTFTVVSDTHFGFGDIEKDNLRLVTKLDAVAGTPYPPSLSGTVARPRGLLVTGDLTEWGKVDEWQPFVKTYGLDGGDGAIHLPVYEVIGNHDKVHGPWVEEQVRARHGGGRFYAWDWDDLHLVALGEAPDDEALAFLAKDLAPLGSDVPLVLYFHLAIQGRWSTGNWFGDGDYKERFARLLEGRNVVAVFHGHHHATDTYEWHGIDVVKPGAVKDGAHTFAVVHVTDDRASVAFRDWERDAWVGVIDRRLPRLAH